MTTLLWPTFLFLSLLVMRLCRAVEYVAEGTCTPMQQRNILGRRKDARRFLFNLLQWRISMQYRVRLKGGSQVA